MKIFIDSADLTEIRDAAAMGVIDGVTTNPSLVAPTKRPLRDVIRDICEIVDGPISAEVVATDTDGILREGRELAKIHPNVVVKVPLLADGLKAVRVFTKEGIKTNVTLCFSPTQAMLAAKAGATYISPFIGRVDDIAGEGIKFNVTLCFSANQALLAAKAGATYISPFIGRLDDAGHDGMQVIRDICLIYKNYSFATEVLTASIRHPLHVLDAAKAGSHVATMPFGVFDKLISHPLTDLGIVRFLEDYRKIPK